MILSNILELPSAWTQSQGALWGMFRLITLGSRVDFNLLTLRIDQWLMERKRHRCKGRLLGWSALKRNIWDGTCTMEGNAKTLTNACLECAMTKLSRAWEDRKVTRALATSTATTVSPVDHRPNGHLQHNAWLWPTLGRNARQSTTANLETSAGNFSKILKTLRREHRIVLSVLSNTLHQMTLSSLGTLQITQLSPRNQLWPMEPTANLERLIEILPTKTLLSALA